MSKYLLAMRAILGGLVWLASLSSLSAATVIQTENAQPGTTGWILANPATNHEIEGYASLTSVNVGNQIQFYVNTADPSFQIDIYRMGWYAGNGGRLMTTMTGVTGVVQPAPVLSDPNTAMLECNWSVSYTLSVPTTWVSGIYLAKLTGGSSTKQSYIVFVVREDSRASVYLYQNSAITYEAYNNWGGRSMYSFNSPDGVAEKVSFNRPYGINAFHTPAMYGVGAGEFLTNVQAETVYASGWDVNMVRYLESQGLDVTYASDVDLHENPALLSTHTALLVGVHDSYWTSQMRTALTTAISSGVNVGFFGAEAIDWQMRFETSPISGVVDRTIVCYKDSNDPVTGVGQTVQWRAVGLPEEAIIGAMFYLDPANTDIVVTNPSNWVFAGTGLVSGSHLTGLLGYEVDNEHGSQPAGTVQLAHSPLDQSGAEYGDMTVYTAPSGATVFDAGSMQFIWGLDDDPLALRPSLLSTAAQQIAANVLAKLAQGAAMISVSPGSISLSAGQSQQFTSNVTGTTNTAVTWSISPATAGSISSSGQYTAPSSIAAQQTVTVIATSSTNSAVTGSASITLVPVAVPVTVAVAPTVTTLSAGQTQQFTSTVTGTTNTAVTWSATPAGIGSVSASGLYTAPTSIASQTPVTVTATSAASSAEFASATITLTVSSVPVAVTVSPTSATLTAGASQQFTATVSNTSNTSVTWSVSPPGVGTVSATGLYTAPATLTAGQSVAVIASSVADATKSASAALTLSVGNAVQVENALPGTTSWMLSNPALNHEIEGYASLTSANIGSQIQFYVNTADPTYQIDVYRMGWYNGAGARLMTTISGLPGVVQSAPVLSDPNTALVECNWTPTYTLSVPTNWVSGIYLAKLTGSSTSQSYIIFVVRDDNRSSAYLYQNPATTYAAYNNWGGESLYPFNSPWAASVSFNRPYALSTFHTPSMYGVGAAEFLTNIQGETVYASAWEVNLVRFLERQGYDVTYATDVDLHENPNILSNHSALLSTGHDEYWSMDMRNTVVSAISQGVSLAVFGADAADWQIRFGPSPVSGAADRTVICYKNATNDPVQGQTNTIEFRNLPTPLPQEAWIGEQFYLDPYNTDIVISDASSWLLAGTGLNNGDHLAGLEGYEVDNVQGHQPANVDIVAHSELDQSGAEWGDMTVYTAPSGATVFDSGTLQFVWGLDDDPLALRPSFLSTPAQQIVINLLARMGRSLQRVAVSPATSMIAAGGTQQFVASVAGSSDNSVTWTISPAGAGSISSSGLYTAPATVTAQQTITVTATSTANSASFGTASLTLTPPVSVSLSPATISLDGGGTQQFTATVTNSSNTAVTWSISPAIGSVSPTGLYAAPSVVTAPATVTITATSVANAAKSAAATINLQVVHVTVSPASFSLNEGQTKVFTASVTGGGNTKVTWSISPALGTISTTGSYKAPTAISSPGTVTVTATSQADNTRSASAIVTLVPVTVTVTPPSVSLRSAGSQQFTAKVTGAGTSVKWTISPSVGTISSTGLYKAPSKVTSSQSVVVKATSTANTAVSASATVTLSP